MVLRMTRYTGTLTDADGNDFEAVLDLTAVEPPPPPPPPPPTSNVWTVNGRNLVTPSGVTYPTINGVESIYVFQNGVPTWAADRPAHIARMSSGAGKGINAQRLLFFMGLAGDGQPGWQTCTPQFINDAIMSSVNAGVPVDVALSGGKDPAVYGRADVKAVLQPLEKHITGLHVFGEDLGTDAAAWQTNAIAAVQLVRSFGYKCPFTVMANYGGRNIGTIRDRGAAVLAADPLHNTWFGWQGYWGGNLDSNGTNDYYQKASGQISFRQAVALAASLPFRVQEGNCSQTDFTVTLVLDRQALCVTSGVGTMWWSMDSGANLVQSGPNPGPPYDNGVWNTNPVTPGEQLVKSTTGMANATRVAYL